MADVTSVFIVRHGESTWNALRKWQGRADPPLSERGESQARTAANALGVLGVLGSLDGIVTSSLRRARRTGELIAEATGLALLDPVVDLSERSAGLWEGLTRVEIDERFPGFLASGERPEGYEPDHAVVARALAAITAVAATHRGGRLLVVSHGGVIHALERHTSAETSEWQRLDNLEGRWFHSADDALHANGDRVHLLDTAPETSDVDGYA
jgi:probable phosphoglycerate mutase